MSMARRRALVVMLAATPVSVVAGEDPVARLELVWIAPDGTAPVTPAMRESRGLLRRLGVEVRWTHASSMVLDAAQTPVIILRGQPLQAAGGSFVMGATRAGSTPRAVWIYPDAVARVLGFESAPEDRFSEEAFGLALGRVIAHELVHLLLESSDHARFGLMAAGLDRQSLLSPTLAVDPATRRALRRAPLRRSPGDVDVASAPLDISAQPPRYD